MLSLYFSFILKIIILFCLYQCFIIRQLDQFDDLGDLVAASELQSQAEGKPSRDLEAQKRFINEIRNSTNFFKVKFYFRIVRYF